MGGRFFEGIAYVAPNEYITYTKRSVTGNLVDARRQMAGISHAKREAERDHPHHPQRGCRLNHPELEFDMIGMEQARKRMSPWVKESDRTLIPLRNGSPRGTRATRP